MELLERGALLDELAQASETAARGGPGRVVILEGEADVGKSSVLRTLTLRVGSDVRALRGACDALARLDVHRRGDSVAVARSGDLARSTKDG